MLLRAIMAGGGWHGFLPGKSKGTDIHCRFCDAQGGDVHLFWECPFPPLVHLRHRPAAADLAIVELECAFGGYPIRPGTDWCPWWDPEDTEFFAAPNMWTDGSRESTDQLNVEIAENNTSFSVKFSARVFINVK